jgi:predicted DNA-binding transcriptional regulator YafY
MNRIDRLQAILIQLQTKRIIKAKEIAERFEISLRTVYRDINALTEGGIPIGAEAGIGYYLMEGYSLPPVMFTPEEAGSLIMAGKLFEKYSDNNLKKLYKSALDKIKAVMNLNSKDFLENLENRIEVFTFNKDENKSDSLIGIHQALSENKVAFINYQAGNKEITERLIEPIYLFFYSSNWHLLAYCRLRNDYRDFRVDRINNFTVTRENFDRIRHGTINEIFNKIISGLDIIKITLRIKDKTLINQIKVRFYNVIEENETNDYHEITGIVDSIEYFAKSILCFGSDIKIITPHELKEYLRDYSKKVSEYYSNL